MVLRRAFKQNYFGAKLTGAVTKNHLNEYNSFLETDISGMECGHPKQHDERDVVVNALTFFYLSSKYDFTLCVKKS